MIGLILIYFIGKAFYNLAGHYDQKQQWLYAILGVFSYYLGSFLAGVILFILSFELELFKVEEMNETTLGLIGVPFGGLACWGFYQFLKYYWSKKSDDTDSDTLDGDFLQRYGE